MIVITKSVLFIQLINQFVYQNKCLNVLKVIDVIVKYANVYKKNVIVI